MEEKEFGRASPLIYEIFCDIRLLSVLLTVLVSGCHNCQNCKQ